MYRFHYARHAQPILPYGTDLEKNDSLFLHPDGVEQAKDLGTRLIGSKISRIITSDFPRAIHTGALAGKIIGARHYQQTELLNEVHHGNELLLWLQTGVGTSDQNDRPAEAITSVRQRLRQFLEQFEPDQETLVVAHGLLFSVLLLQAAKLPDDTPVLANPGNIELAYAENRLVQI